jgi:hypothetical protein
MNPPLIEADFFVLQGYSVSMLIGKLYSIRTGLLLTMAGIQFGDNFKTQSFFSGTITYIAKKNAKSERLPSFR